MLLLLLMVLLLVLLVVLLLVPVLVLLLLQHSQNLHRLNPPPPPYKCRMYVWPKRCWTIYKWTPPVCGVSIGLVAWKCFKCRLTIPIVTTTTTTTTKDMRNLEGSSSCCTALLVCYQLHRCLHHHHHHRLLLHINQPPRSFWMVATMNIGLWFSTPSYPPYHVSYYLPSIILIFCKNLRPNPPILPLMHSLAPISSRSSFHLPLHTTHTPFFIPFLIPPLIPFLIPPLMSPPSNTLFSSLLSCLHPPTPS